MDPQDDWLQRALAELRSENAQAPTAVAPGQDPGIQRGIAESQAAEADWAARALAEIPEYAKDPTAWEQARAGAQSLAAGAVSGLTQTFGDMPQNLGTLVARGLLNIADGLGVEVPRNQDGSIIFPDEPGALDLPAKIQGLGARAEEALAPDGLRLQDSPISKGAQVLGSTAPGIISALLGGAPLAAAQMAAQQGGASAQDAAAGGGSPMKQAGAMVGGALLGAAGALPLENALGRLTALSPTVIKRLANAGVGTKAVAGTAESVAAGAASGAAYVALTNAIHNWATDDDIPVLSGAAEGGLYGAALGGVIRGATEAAIAKRRITGRRYTSQGWTGELLPEDASPPEPGEFHPPEDLPLSERVERAANALDAEMQSGSIPRGASIDDLRMLAGADFGLPRQGAEQAVTRAFELAMDRQNQRAERMQATREGLASVDAERAIAAASEEQLAEAQRFATDPRSAAEVLIERMIPSKRAKGIQPKEKPIAPLSEAERVAGEEAFDVASHSEQFLAGESEARREAFQRDFDERLNKARRAKEIDLEWERPERPDWRSEAQMRADTLAEMRAAEEAGRAAKREAERAPNRTYTEQFERVRRGTDVYSPPRRPDYSAIAPDMVRAMNPVMDPVSKRVLVTDIGITDASGKLVGGTGLRVTLDDTWDVRAAPILRADVISATEQAVKQLTDFAVRTRLVPPGWAGFYDPNTKVARLAKYGDILTAAHEAGHAVETVAFGGPDSPLLAPRAPVIQAELAKLGKALYQDVVPHNGYVSEGFAEYMKLYLAQHEDLMRHAPETTAWFEDKFLRAHPEFGTALDEVRQRFDQYRFQGSEKRTQVVDPSDWKTRFRSTSAADQIFKLQKNWIESGQILFNMNREAVERGVNTKRGESAYENFVALRGTADSVLHNFANEETYLANQTRTGDSLRAILAPVRGSKLKPFERYLALRASEWRATQKTRVDPATGERVLARQDTPFAGIDITHQMAALEAKYPEFRGTSDALLAWYDRVIEYAVSRNPEMRPVFQMLRQQGEFYMPLKRWADWYENTATRAGSATKTAARMAQEGKRSKGSTRETVSPLLALQVEARNVIQRSHERAIQNAVIDEAQRAVLSEYVLDVTKDIKRMAQVKGALEANGALLSPNETVNAAALPLMDMQAFMVGAIDTPEGPIVPRRTPKLNEQGALEFETRWYQFHPELHKAVLSSDPESFQVGLPFLGVLGRLSKRAFVLGATGARASFGLITNPTRDFQALFVNSRYNPHIVPLLGQLAYEHTRVALAEFSHGVIPYKWKDVYDKFGLHYSGRYGSLRDSRKTVDKATRTVMGRTLHTLLDPRDWLDVLAHLSSITEKGTRIWELKQSAKAVDWKPGKPMSPQQAVHMAIDARQVTIDFAAGGAISQQINQFVPFFNATIQGPRGSIRALKHHPLGWALSTATLAAFGLANYLAHKDEDWMLALQPWERWSYWHFPTTAADGTKGLVRIPVAPDAGFLPKSIEFLADGLSSKNPMAFEDWAAQSISSMTMDVWPPALREGVQQWANRADFGTDRPIIPENELNKTATGEMQRGEQAGPYTGQLSIAVGKALNISPRRIDHAMKGLFAGVGAAVSDANLFGLVNYHTRPDEPSDLPVAGILFRKGGAVSQSSRWISELYDLAPSAIGALKLNPSPETFNMHMLLENATQAISFGSALLEEGDLTVPQRQELMNSMNTIAKSAIEKVRAGGIVDPRETMRKRAVLELDVLRMRSQMGKTP
jgi:Large polyvalent protein associated domain 38